MEMMPVGRLFSSTMGKCRYPPESCHAANRLTHPPRSDSNRCQEPADLIAGERNPDGLELPLENALLLATAR